MHANNNPTKTRPRKKKTVQVIESHLRATLTLKTLLSPSQLLPSNDSNTTDYQHQLGRRNHPVRRWKPGIALRRIRSRGSHAWL
jgi:hypothetical protein